MRSRKENMVYATTRNTNANRSASGGIPRLQACAIALLSYGFRPFFLGAAVWACVAMVLWVGLLTGIWSFAKGYGAVVWHSHELLFGYIPAVMTGHSSHQRMNGMLPPLLTFGLLASA